MSEVVHFRRCSHGFQCRVMPGIPIPWRRMCSARVRTSRLLGWLLSLLPSMWCTTSLRSSGRPIFHSRYDSMFMPAIAFGVGQSLSAPA